MTWLFTIKKQKNYDSDGTHHNSENFDHVNSKEEEEEKFAKFALRISNWVLSNLRWWFSIKYYQSLHCGKFPLEFIFQRKQIYAQCIRNVPDLSFRS